VRFNGDCADNEHQRTEQRGCQEHNSEVVGPGEKGAAHRHAYGSANQLGRHGDAARLPPKFERLVALPEGGRAPAMDGEGAISLGLSGIAGLPRRMPTVQRWRIQAGGLGPDVDSSSET
jgi:hypothetical protein